MSEFLPVGYKLSKERQHARSAFGFAGPSESRRQGGQSSPSQYFCRNKSKNFLNLECYFPSSLGFSDLPTALLCTVAVTVAGSQVSFSFIDLAKMIALMNNTMCHYCSYYCSYCCCCCCCWSFSRQNCRRQISEKKVEQ